MKSLKQVSNLLSLLLVFSLIFAFTSPIDDVVAPSDALKPDLLVRAIQFPDGFKLGTCTEVRAAIANSSMTAAGTFKVELYLSESGHPVKQLYTIVKGIGPKKTVWVTFKDVPVLAKQQAKLQVTADISKSVVEANEYNNKKLIYPKPKSQCK